MTAAAVSPMQIASEHEFVACSTPHSQRLQPTSNPPPYAMPEAMYLMPPITGATTCPECPAARKTRSVRSAGGIHAPSATHDVVVIDPAKSGQTSAARRRPHHREGGCCVLPALAPQSQPLERNREKARSIWSKSGIHPGFILSTGSYTSLVTQHVRGPGNRSLSPDFKESPRS